MRVLHYLSNFFVNAFVCLLRPFIWKSKRVWLFGSWMGLKFADNSRFLFQYLSDNLKKYNLKKVVWVTNKKELLEELRILGYSVVKRNSIKSFYYHLRAGVHVICNMPCGNSSFKGDINGKLSIGAIKIQCWHGVPIKSNLRPLKNNWLISSSFFKFFFDAGHWYKQYVLSTSQKCTSLMKQWFNEDYKYIECGYPRYLINEKYYISGEADVVSAIRKHRFALLYAPTFRNYIVDFEHPLNNKILFEYLVKNDILWIEKPHPATKNNVFFSHDETVIKSENYLKLNPDFDINILLPMITIVISDYSSVCYDGMYYNKPIIYYAPDILRYSSSDRGFVVDYKNMIFDSYAPDCQQLLDRIDLFLSSKTSVVNSKTYMSIKREIYGELSYSFETLVHFLFNSIKIKPIYKTKKDRSV